MATRTATLSQAGLPQIPALNGGIATAFTVAALISIAAVILAFFIRNSKPPVEEQSMEYELAAGEQPVSDDAATRN